MRKKGEIRHGRRQPASCTSNPPMPDPHHDDLDFDVTTGVRFHTVEILLSMGIKLAAVVLLGAPALGVLTFEILLNATSLFSHGNVRVPAWLDPVLRLFVVTPDMHRV